MNTINVNGTDIEYGQLPLSISYGTVVQAAGRDPQRIYTVTYTTRRKGDEQRQGTMHPGLSILLEPGMVFNVADTSNG